MAIRQRLEQGQRPILSQSLKQSLKMLELPLLELKNIVEEEIVDNPVIEEVQKDPSSASSSEALPKVEVQREPEDETTSFFEREVIPRELANYKKPIPGKKETLAEVLLRQLRINASDERQVKIGTHIIHNIDENGYLHQDTPSLCAGGEFSEKEVRKALRFIQTFEPAGVGARDLKECLLIQLRKKNEKDALTLKLVENHIQDLAGRELKKLCKKLKCRQEELIASIKKIRSLEPKPGRGYSTDETVYIIPDITIEEKDDTLNITARDETIPTIRVNPVYKNMLKSKKVNEETKKFIRERMRNANSLISAIQSRKETLIKVISIIAETQKEALLEGMDRLKPLALKEIAEMTGMHESTISRVVMNKYVQTPVGIFPLRQFFSTSLTTEGGEAVSSQSIKLKIKELVDSEDKSHPLRDQKIVELLKESEKIDISRRTVAKYRESLKIPPASQRRHSL